MCRFQAPTGPNATVQIARDDSGPHMNTLSVGELAVAAARAFRLQRRAEPTLTCATCKSELSSPLPNLFPTLHQMHGGAANCGPSTLTCKPQPASSQRA